jgi:hypothetical protein
MEWKVYNPLVVPAFPSRPRAYINFISSSSKGL